jgi:hypothetical protein
MIEHLPASAKPSVQTPVPSRRQGGRTNAGWEEGRGPFCSVGGNVNYCGHTQISIEVPQKTKNRHWLTFVILASQRLRSGGSRFET